MDVRKKAILSILIGGILTLFSGYYIYNYVSYRKIPKEVYLGALLIIYSVFVLLIIKRKQERTDNKTIEYSDATLLREYLNHAQYGVMTVDHIEKQLKNIYKKVKYIDYGGFAYVFRVEDKEGNVYAVKVPLLRNKDDEKLFFNEVEKWQRLKHRNIVKMVKICLNPPHIVLEYVKGKSLEKLLREKGNLDVLEACKIAFDVARALEYSHQERIYHCDVKPSNILLDEELGEAKLTDFGLAKRKGSEAKGGTLSYLPPEGLDDWSDKSDIYQLGLVLYEMIAGRLPRRKNYEPLSKFNPEARGLDDLIRRCLSENPKERPNAREFRIYIYEFLKKRYGLNLEMSKDYDELVKLSVKVALYAVKMAVSSKENEVKEYLIEALISLETAEKYATSEVREFIRKAIDEINFWIERATKPGEALIDKLRYLVRRLES